MGENEQRHDGSQPETPGPVDPPAAGPSPRDPVPYGAGPVDPAQLDAEQLARFQEFQRFQEYLRYSQQSQQPGGELVPSGQPGTDLQRHLAGMSQQLAELGASQARVERVVNPPTWQKVLRNKWLHRLLWLVLLAVLAVWVVPLVVRHYFGGSDQNPGGPGAALPAPKTQSHELPHSPNDAVADLYYFIASGHPTQACFLFDNRTAGGFAHAFGSTDCQQAVPKIRAGLTDATAYSTVSLANLPTPVNGQQRITISSCDFTVAGGPALGTFDLTRQPDNTWEITGYTAPAPCPTPSASTPPTS